MIAFVHIKKTGGSTMKFVLRNSFGVRHCDVLPGSRESVFTRDDLEFVKRVYPNPQSIAGHSLVHPTIHLPEGVHYFTLLRDPVMRCISHYQSTALALRKAGRRLSLEEFIGTEQGWNVQVRQIAGTTDVDKAKEELARRYFFVGLTERFDESLRLLQALAPVPIDVRCRRRVREASDNLLKDALLVDPAMMKRLRAANGADQALYEYVSDVLYPAQLEKAGLASDLGGDDARSPGRFPVRNRLSRAYNKMVYKPLARLRRRRCDTLPPVERLNPFKKAKST
jgi:hypothetical protein